MSTPVRGYLPGGWDMFHIGHLSIIRRARELCDHLIVGVATDEALIAAKGRPPIVPLAERCEVVAALSIVDDVITDRGGNKADVWRRRAFDILFKGDDWQGTAKGDGLEHDMAEIGVGVHYLSYTPQISSTFLRAVVSDPGRRVASVAPPKRT